MSASDPTGTIETKLSIHRQDRDLIVVGTDVPNEAVGSDHTMGVTEDRRELSPAWAYFKRTGVILPGYQDDIAERLSEYNGEGKHEERGEEGAKSGRAQA